MAGAFLVSFSAVSVQAQDEVALDEPSDQDGSPIELTFSGFVDSSVFIPIDGFPSDGDEVTFGVDQAEIDVIAEIAPADIEVRIDLNAFPSAGGLGQLLTQDGLIEQAVFTWMPTDIWFLTVGKQNAPVGAEALDPVDMYQYSHGLLFDNASPSNLTGLFTGIVSGDFGAQVWVTNDWDVAAAPRSASVGGRLDFGFNGGGVGLASTFGPLVADDPRLMLDLDANFATGGLTLFVEGNYGSVGDLTSLGAMFKANYAFIDPFSATVRFDWLDQEGGVENTIATAVAFLYSFNDYLGGLVEYRVDVPDGADAIMSVAAEFTAFF